MSMVKRGFIVVVVLWSALRMGIVCLDAWFPLSLQRVKDVSFCVYDHHGRLLHMMLSPQEHMCRLPVCLDEVDAGYLKALVLFEDKRFYFHGGVDVWAGLRALAALVVQGRVVSGASTITMQTVRLLEPHPRTLWCKLKECVYAWHLERIFSKDDILAMYLTLAPYGGNIEGVRAASLAYFGHDVDAFGPEEIAFLLALPRAPSALCPQKGCRAFSVRGHVLQAMQRFGLIDAESCMFLRKQPLPKPAWHRPVGVPHLSARLRREQPGARCAQVFIDWGLQKHVEKVIASSPHQVAAMVVDTRTHQVVAYAGSQDAFSYEKHGFVDYALAVRSPGSTLKPFVYALALEKGVVHEDTRVQDCHRRFLGYAPGNFDEVFRGDVSVKSALRLSLNTPVVYLLDMMGVSSLMDVFAQAGVRLHFKGEASLAIALGGCGVTLESMMVLYAGLLDGVLRPIAYAHGVSCGAKSVAFAPQTVRTVRGMLLHKSFADGRGVSLKTGTSQGHKDAWCFGVDERYVVGVWCGHHDGRSLENCSGASSAGPLVENIFAYLPQTVQEPLEACLDTDVVTLKPPMALQRLSDAQPLRIHHPRDQSVFVSQEECVIPVDVRGACGDVLFFVNGQEHLLEKQQEGYAWRVQEGGLYTLSAVDASGACSRVQVLVRTGKY